MKFSNLPFAFTLIIGFQAFVSTAQQSWQPVQGGLTTPWTDKVTSEAPYPEYPRPTMIRPDWFSLNGLWNISLQDQGTGRPHKSGQILVPYPVESALSGCGWRVEPQHELIYTKRAFIYSRWKGQRVLLHFGAVDWQTTVFVNGKKIGEHKGGYDPFFFDISNEVIFGTEAEISVHVTDPTSAGGQALGKQTLTPGGIYYTPISGIWQSVWLEPVPQAFIRSYRVEPDIEKSRALVRVETEGMLGGQKVVASLLHDGRAVSSASGKPGAPLLISVKDGHLWSLDDPFLYDIEIAIEDNGRTVDKVKGYFGLRKSSVGPDENGVTRLMLNDKPIFQLGPLDQGFWPDGLYTAPNEEAMEYDIETLKSLGFNMIRKHVKVEPERWYYLCDKLGILVWQDMPSAEPKTEEDRTQFKWEMKAMVDNLFNHPSIVMWVPFNEGWGQHETAFYVEKLRDWDPTRIVDNASGWTDAGVGDVLDIHDYPGPSSPKVVDGRAAVLGEFGGLGLNVVGHQWAKDGWGYQQISTPEELLNRYESLYWKLFELQENEGLAAAVYTQVSDVETESNGLMTYDRKVLKIDPALLKLVHRGQMPPKPTTNADIFVKKMNVSLRTIKPNAVIEYAIENGKAPLKWQRFSEPILLKSTTTIVTRAAWPDSLKSHEQRYVFTKTKAMKPKGKTGNQAGISAKVYEGSWDSLPDFSEITPVKELVVSDLSLKQVEKKEDFGVVYEGWLEVPNMGAYTLHLRSDDGSRLQLDGQLVIDHDGLHGMNDQPKSVALAAGKHPLKLEFFQKKGGVGLEFWLEDAMGKRMEAKLGH
ncbi:MAG: glycoside hydrolase family 2 [Bacteroidetes bacterium]|nr:glycoside hydrolase family 2 [Bacteroidota bacterium]